LNLHSSLSATDQFSHPYEAVGKILGIWKWWPTGN